jgi:hypothetical protein
MQVFIPERKKWVNCDPTWDLALEKAGFPIANWDGVSDTEIAVVPVKIFTSEQSRVYKEKWSDPQKIMDHLEYHYQFYKAINKWMMTLR